MATAIPHPYRGNTVGIRAPNGSTKDYVSAFLSLHEGGQIDLLQAWLPWPFSYFHES
jgi:hypothetical protein